MCHRSPDGGWGKEAEKSEDPYSSPASTRALGYSPKLKVTRKLGPTEDLNNAGTGVYDIHHGSPQDHLPWRVRGAHVVLATAQLCPCHPGTLGPWTPFQNLSQPSVKAPEDTKDERNRQVNRSLKTPKPRKEAGIPGEASRRSMEPGTPLAESTQRIGGGQPLKFSPTCLIYHWVEEADLNWLSTALRHKGKN